MFCRPRCALRNEEGNSASLFSFIPTLSRLRAAVHPRCLRPPFIQFVTRAVTHQFQPRLPKTLANDREPRGADRGRELEHCPELVGSEAH
jgi:hypothetical protein